jgi:hypothetical protein
MTVMNILVGLTVWTAVSVVASLAIGAFMSFGSVNDAMIPVPSHVPAHKTAA